MSTAAPASCPQAIPVRKLGCRPACRIRIAMLATSSLFVAAPVGGPVQARPGRASARVACSAIPTSDSAARFASAGCGSALAASRR